MCNPVPNDRFRMTRAGAAREVDGTCRRNTSRPETLCSKAFASKTGGWEVGFAENALVIKELFADVGTRRVTFWVGKAKSSYATVASLHFNRYDRIGVKNHSLCSVT